MRKILFCLLAAFLLPASFCFTSCGSGNDFEYGQGQTGGNEGEEPEEPEEPKPELDTVVLAYVTSWTPIMPDPNVLTHINYAFGHVNDTYKGIRIDNETRLKSIVALKSINPDLKVLLSVGGWESGGFSEMAASENNRKLFAEDCKRVIDEFNLDGIDIDWEFPTSSVAGISSSPQDTKNYNLMMAEVRKKIGNSKLLTLASAASAKYYDFETLAGIVDFVNIMMYDVNIPPFHQSALFRSEHVKDLSAQESINLHVSAGFPVERLVLGIPFYGKSVSPLKESTTYREIIKLTDYPQKWDDKAKVPYLVDGNGKIICVFDNPQSIYLKCDYVKERKMLGVMYWEYAGDDDQGSLRNAAWSGMKEVI